MVSPIPVDVKEVAMKRLLVLAGAVLSVLLPTFPAPAVASQVARPVHTYSIVARDSVTGEMGVAVQSHWFSVGTVVSWAEAGVGAVATQSLAEISYGPLGLDLMRAGKTAQQALDALLAADPHADVRQVAMVDARGNVAVHTGENCIAMAGHTTGPQVSVQANLMENNSVWPAMLRAYMSAEGDLAERLLAALDAAQAEGGDIRGKQSAAILIVPGESTGRPYADKVMDLRVDDSAEPLEELRRLVQVHRAYDFMNEGDERIAEGNTAGALESYDRAAEILPDNPEVKFWAAITMMQAGNVNEALDVFEEVFAADPKWREVVRRLPGAGLLEERFVEPILEAGAAGEPAR
jgi:uncharacterized Ntn-hydrolase superfamily protein